jgi:hypothetical protein
VILAASIVSAFSPRFRLFVRSLVGETTYRLGESGDPEYAAFLDGVRRLTPPDATIALVLPADTKPYVSEAASRLAPRRVVLRGREKEASFVAAYRYQYRDVRNPDVMSVPHGALFRRR